MEDKSSEHIFDRIDEKVNFPSLEVNILKYWDSINAFQKSLKLSEGNPEYSFYDGPPFATGLPHYGHHLAGTIKDIVTRYFHQTGRHIVRRFGWDCHGLPIEHEIDKKLKIQSRADVIKYGIANYNRECRSIVMTYSKEWRELVTRMGRWIDFDNDYKTMNITFMETVWWVFKQLYEKDLVYQGFKVMPYSWACATPLSNFEANLNYKDVSDPAIIVSFPILGDNKYASANASFLAWTTTPWTLPSNLALCVNENMDYVMIRNNEGRMKNAIWIVAKSRLEFLYPKKKGAKAADYIIVENDIKGSSLVGLHYEPLFKYFANKPGFAVLSDDYVTTESGTGVVHQAPGFGEDDFRVCLANNIFSKDGSDLVCPVDADGKFTAEVKDFEGRFVKDCDDDICKILSSHNRLISKSSIVHSYPFCWRKTDKPLIYKAVPSLFVRVTKLKDRLIDNNLKTYWVPSFVKERRFHNWLSDAVDWSISRNRFWGTPIPLWRSNDGKETIVIGSIQELKDLSGVQDINDLHRHHIDSIEIPSRDPERKGKEFSLKRIDDVFDCWFESGSMPYAQMHYPFENKEYFEKSFPADFIAEGLDQTRGWFYTLLVISTGLFNQPAFKNLIVNGLVLAKDGKKMSKSLKNYPNPSEIINNYGADSLRLYLINSPVVRAEPLRFNENGVKDIARDVFLPWYNTYRFFVEQCRRMESKGFFFKRIPNIHKVTTSVMDRWIIASLQSLITFVRNEMSAYRLYTVIPRLLNFIDQLSRWYVRFNKSRLKGEETEIDRMHSLATLYEVLFSLCKLMAPFTPFLVESIYFNLSNGLDKNDEERVESVHFLKIPIPDETAMNEEIERKMTHLQRVIELGRIARASEKIPFRQPVNAITVIHESGHFLSDVKSLVSYVEDQLNVKNVSFCDLSSISQSVIRTATPDRKILGPRLQGNAKTIFTEILALNNDKIVACQNSGSITIQGQEIKKEEIIFGWKFVGNTEEWAVVSDSDLFLMMDKRIDDKLIAEYGARAVTRFVQNMRKRGGITPEDPIEVFVKLPPESKQLESIIHTHSELISSILHLSLRVNETPVNEKAIILSDDTSIDEENISFILCKKL